jgi:hypothetical protein
MPRWPALVAVCVAVLAAHLALLGGAPTGSGGGSGGSARPVLQTRQIVQAPALHEAPAAAELPTPVREGTLPPVAEVQVAAPPEPASAPASGPTGPPGAAGGDTVPVYSTLLPASAALDYELRRGQLVGSANLRWQLADGSYRISFDGRAFDLAVFAWLSQGGVDSAGLAPLRFTETPRNRPTQAANFQRDKGLLTYSGPTVEFTLVPGAQDRASWLVQLPAILQANPALREPGSRISLFVSGARGDADVWEFVVQGRESLALPAGAVADTLRLLRSPRRPYDTRAEVWLDPARDHLPVRALLATVDSGDTTELLLK